MYTCVYIYTGIRYINIDSRNYFNLITRIFSLISIELLKTTAVFIILNNRFGHSLPVYNTLILIIKYRYSEKSFNYARRPRAHINNMCYINVNV